MASRFTLEPSPSAVKPSADSSDSSPAEIAAAIQSFLADHPGAAVLEDGRILFELGGAAQHTLTAEHGRCTLHLWSEERNLVRSVIGWAARDGTLRLRTQRFGHSQTKLLELVAQAQPRTPARRQPARKQYLRLLERVLAREFRDWQPEAFRTAMDLERSFGPAYARGCLVQGREAWAVIGAGASESQAVMDGILTLGILWLHHCRERGDGRRLYKGLRLVVPRGAATLTLARLPWMNPAAGQWELYELDERTEELTARDPADQGNLRTRLMHLPDAAAAYARFSAAVPRVMALVPPGEEHRVEQRLRSTSELAFVLHGLEFARIRLSLAPNSFSHRLEITAGGGAAQTALTPGSEAEIRAHIAELFRRRRAVPNLRVHRPLSSARSIGTFTGRAVHARIGSFSALVNGPGSRLEFRERARAAHTDPLFRAAPERWLESVLRENLAPLTRSLAPPAAPATAGSREFANDPDPDSIGNRSTDPGDSGAPGWPGRGAAGTDRIIPKFDSRFVYTQVPAVAGASDRGMLDLLGVTADGRLAVIELKTSDDLQLALQGLDYWVRVRHHQAQATDPATGLPLAGNDLQRHGYFREVELSPLPPRLYLVAPALHVHPATETILRYLSPRVEWTLLALDERWRQEVRVVWRRKGGRADAG